MIDRQRFNQILFKIGKNIEATDDIDIDEYIQKMLIQFNYFKLKHSRPDTLLTMIDLLNLLHYMLRLFITRYIIDEKHEAEYDKIHFDQLKSIIEDIEYEFKSNWIKKFDGNEISVIFTLFRILENIIKIHSLRDVIDVFLTLINEQITMINIKNHILKIQEQREELDLPAIYDFLIISISQTKSIAISNFIKDGIKRYSKSFFILQFISSTDQFRSNKNIQEYVDHLHSEVDQEKISYGNINVRFPTVIFQIPQLHSYITDMFNTIFDIANTRIVISHGPMNYTKTTFNSLSCMFDDDIDLFIDHQTKQDDTQILKMYHTYPELVFSLEYEMPVMTLNQCKDIMMNMMFTSLAEQHKYKDIFELFTYPDIIRVIMM